MAEQQNAPRQFERQWLDLQNLNRYKDYRSFYEPALTKSLMGVLLKFPPLGRTIELGSGGGELRKRFPRAFVANTIHVDSSHPYNKFSKASSPSAQIITGD